MREISYLKYLVGEENYQAQVNGAARYDDVRIFIDETGWEDWMDDLVNNKDRESVTDEEIKEINLILTTAFKESRNSCAARIRKIRKATGLSQQKFGERYKIPLRTLQNWETGVNKAPEYLLDLIEKEANRTVF